MSSLVRGFQIALIAIAARSGSAGASTVELTLQNVSITDVFLHQTVFINGTITGDTTTNQWVSGYITSTMPNDPCFTSGGCLTPVFDSSAGAVFSNNGAPGLSQLLVRAGTPSAATWAPYDTFGFVLGGPLDTAPGGIVQFAHVGEDFYRVNSSHTAYKPYQIFANPGGSNTFTGYVQVVPEPEAFAMLLAGLGLIGVASMRRKA